MRLLCATDGEGTLLGSLGGQLFVSQQGTGDDAAQRQPLRERAVTTNPEVRQKVFKLLL